MPLIGNTHMPLISLNTAAQLTGVSKRTLWRRIASGTLPVERSADPQGRTLVFLEDIAKEIGVPLNSEVIGAIQRADTGLARDQMDLALIFLEAGLTEKALPWLQLAADQSDADAMLTLGETQLNDKKGDPVTGLNWMRRAAIAGHPLALAVIEAFPNRLRNQDHSAKTAYRARTTDHKCDRDCKG